MMSLIYILGYFLRNTDLYKRHMYVHDFNESAPTQI